MARKSPPPPKRAKPQRSHSLISDRVFQQMLARMLKLRLTTKRSGMRNLGAVLAGTTVDLKDGDLVVAPAKLAALQLEPPALLLKNASASLPAAIGSAWALRKAGNKGVVVTFGEGDTSSREAWKEAASIASKHHLPILFVLLPGGTEMDTATIASDAQQGGMIVIPVDVADAVAMYRVAFESIARARRGTGPTFIVSTQYALEDGRQSVKADGTEDPVTRMKSYMKSKNIPLS